MRVASPSFAAWAAGTLAIYHVLDARHQRAWLLAVSYAFAALFGWWMPLVLGVTTWANYLALVRVRRSTAWFWGAIAANVCAVAAARAVAAVGTTQLIGMSFFTMQAISVVADVRSGALRDPPSLLELALLQAYFPRLIAGPIERATHFVPQLRQPRTVDDDVVARAGALVCEGVFRMLVLADALALLVPPRLFEDPHAYGAGALAWGAVASTFSLYNEFAGYTQIVRGTSLLFGIELVPNFHQPQFSRSFTEFWGRWHVSLSTWLRDYIYLPLSRAILRRWPRRDNLSAAVVPAFAAMLASGFWHGGASGMMLWGALHGAFLSVERFWAMRHPRTGFGARRPWVQACQMLCVFVLGTLAMIPFRSSASVAVVYWTRLATAGAWELPDPRLVLLVALCLAFDAAQAIGGSETIVLRAPRWVRVLALAALVGAVSLSARGATTALVYQGF